MSLLFPRRFRRIEEDDDGGGRTEDIGRGPDAEKTSQTSLELREKDVSALNNFFRIERRMFQELLTRLGDIIEKDTWYRNENPPGLKLSITLRQLANGASYKNCRIRRIAAT